MRASRSRPMAVLRRAWKIESLNPSGVIAGHKRPGNDDSPQTIEETRQYIRDFDRVALWLSGRAVKP